MTLYTPIIGTKGPSITISESLYGAFNCILFDHATPEVREVMGRTGEMVPKTIFGSTCDGGDVIYKEYYLPDDTQEGDWIVWDNMGAYTLAATTNFNGLGFNTREVIF
jgi:ornithine decarboxylase